MSVGGPPRCGHRDDRRAVAHGRSSGLPGGRAAGPGGAGALGDGGSIAFVLSTSVRAPLPNLAISNGLRPGLAMVAKSLADELAPRGIRVNGLLPGAIRTERLARAAGQPPRGAADPLGRYGEPEEFGRAAAFLLSPAASYVSGVMLPSTAARCAPSEPPRASRPRSGLRGLGLQPGLRLGLRLLLDPDQPLAARAVAPLVVQQVAEAEDRQHPEEPPLQSVEEVRTVVELGQLHRLQRGVRLGVLRPSSTNPP